MPVSLSDLRAAPAPSFPERSVQVCLRPDVVARIQQLQEEIDDLKLPPLPRGQDGAPTGRPRKTSEGAVAPEVKAQFDALKAEMAEQLEILREHEGPIRLRATTTGAWRTFTDQHPARPEGDPGHDRDIEVAGGYCDSDALIDDLATYVVAWCDEPVGEGDWARGLLPNLGRPDQKKLARAVVSMFEDDEVDLGKWSSGLSAILSSSDVSASPAPSGSAPDA